ncbi:cadherin-related family member 5 isoform X2 [Phyllobates terribilis]|uniref:cadherin-related family member 5 isoform X2 n=1 Tax=Phyllobates terribilis TaxID=111132 RepID=UPI003CCAFEE1
MIENILSVQFMYSLFHERNYQITYNPGTDTYFYKIWTVPCKMGPLLALCILFVFPMGCYSQACRSANPVPSIREDAELGTVVTALIIEPGHTAEVEEKQFQVNESNLVLVEELDYETETTVMVTLICKRGSLIVLGETFFVQIINVNDNPPIFKEASYSFQILESQQVGSTFGFPIQAEDADGDTLYYELFAEDRDTADYFRLSSVTYPLLVVNKALDYDLHPQVRMNLTARDTEIPGDYPSFTATTSIIIDIGDADDKPPFFQPCRIIGNKICISDGYRTSVTRSEATNSELESAVVDAGGCSHHDGDPVRDPGRSNQTQPLQLMPGPLYAIDGDYGINDPVAYRIISGNGENIFNIGVATGNITMNKPVDTLGTILLQIMAYQTNDELKYSTTTVNIEVKEKNNFPPRFEKSNYTGTIPSNMEIRSFVRDSSDQTKQLHVFAVDDDFPDGFNPAITYRIENSNNFTILRDGYILTNSVFTSPGTVVFVVNATDSISSESVTANVTIEITNALTTTTTTGPTSTNTRTTTSTTPGTGTTTTTTPSTGTTTSTTPGTGTTTTTTLSTGTTTSTTPGTGTTTATTPSTGTTTSTTPGTGTTTTTTPSTGTTTSTTPGTGTTTTTTPSTGTTTSTTPGTGTTTTTTPSTGTTTSTTPGTGTTTTTTPSTGTTTSTTPGTGITTTTTPSTGTTSSTTPGTGTTTTTTPSTGTTTSTTPGTGTTTATTPNTQSTTSTTPGTGTTITTTSNTRTTGSTTPGTGTTTTTTPNTRTTTSTTPGTGTTTTTTLNTQTTKRAITGTGITKSPATTGKSTGTRSSTTGNGITAAPGPDSTTKNPTPGNEGEKQDKYYTTTDMAILGATLGVVLAACLVGLAFLIYKQYGNTIRSKLRGGTGNNSGGSADRTEQLINEEEYGGSTSASSPEFGIDGVITEVPSGNNLLSAAAVSTVLTTSAPTESPPSEEAEGESDSEDKKVKSILTKDLKEDGGYKSVWFREDAAPEVMVIEGVEHGEASDDIEEEFSNQQENDDDDDEEEDEDDEDELNPTFSTPNVVSNNSSIL